MGAHTLGMVISLQTVVSLFRDDPRLYNPATYLIAGPFDSRVGRRHFAVAFLDEASVAGTRGNRCTFPAACLPSNL